MIRGLRQNFLRAIHRNSHTKKVINSCSGGLTIFYFGIPMHSNLGDLAQYCCIKNFIAKEYPEYNVVEIDSKVFMDDRSSLREDLKHYIKKDDYIFFQSSYCTQDLGGVEDLMHQAVMNDYPDNKLVMFPQTIYFKSEVRRKQASEIYDSHQHLLFLARDMVSYNFAKDMFPHVPVYAYPDIVTTLIGEYHFSAQRKGFFLCLRNDVEKYYQDSDIEMLKARLESVDTVESGDTTLTVKVNAETNNLRSYIDGFIEKLSKYKVVITDRYHGTILSLAANTPVVVIKSNDHKVVTGVDWFKGVYDDRVVYADNLEDAERIAKEFWKKPCLPDAKPHFWDAYYGKLKFLIDDTMEG